MIRLKINREAEWLDLPGGVRVRVKPCTTGLYRAAMRDATASRDAGADSDEEFAYLFAKALARRAIIAWEGVLDSDGEDIQPFAAGVDALIDLPPIGEAFMEKYVFPARLLDAEKNASAPAPNGSSVAGADTATVALN